jgi:phage terminase small subunit
MSELTPKQALFVEAFMLDPDPSKAAIASGSTAKRARQAGYELLTNPDVKAEIERRQSMRSAKTQIDAAWLLERLAAEATADINDLYNSEGGLKPVSEWPLIWRQGLVQGIEVEQLFDGHGEERQAVGTVRKIKLDNRIKRLELIGKHIGVNAFSETVVVKGLDTLADRLERAMKRDG